MSPFEAARKLLSTETTRWSLMDRTELVFQDMDLVPLLVQVRSWQPSQPAFPAAGDRVSRVSRRSMSSWQHCSPHKLDSSEGQSHSGIIIPVDCNMVNYMTA